MFTKSKVTQSMVDAVKGVLGEEKGKLLLEPGKSEKVSTPTGVKVYGHRYGNAAKAHRDQTKNELDKVKGPEAKDIKENKGNQPQETFTDNNLGEEGDCVTKPEAKDIAKKEVKGHEKKMHKEELSFKDKLLESVRRSDVPAYLRKAKGEKPLTPAEVKAPKKDTISHPENLAKARNEEVDLEEAVSRKDFQMVADLIKTHDSHDKRKELAQHHAEIFHRQNPRFDRSKFMKAANVNESVDQLDEKNWIAGAIKKPGSETASAHKAGMSVQAFAQKHKHDSGKAGKRARLAITLKKLHKENIEEVELDEMINEVLSKDATAGDWIHDFVHSKNPKFAGKSKAERKKMALGAYYGKQNEEFVTEAEVVASAGSQDEVTTDTLKGREKGGKSNSFKGYKLQLRTDGEMKAPAIEKGEDTREKQKISTNPGPAHIEYDKKLGHPSVQSHFTKEEVKPALKRIHDKDAKIADKESEKFNKKVEKHQVEECESSWNKETPWKPSKVKTEEKHTPMSRAKDLAKSAFKKLKNETMMGKISN
jgi:hypothetical protein